MLARRLACNSPRRKVLNSVSQPSIGGRPKRSSTWTRAQQATSGIHVGAYTPIQAVTAELDTIAPRIDVDADSIDVIKEPKDFYGLLKDKIQTARRRVYLATLYVGKSEHELVECIREAVTRNPELKVSILTDALRGTRESPEPSCASLLSGLVADFPAQVDIRMYHTPNLTGLRKRIIPRRLNEGWGLQHMKIYGFDDEVILSGANLSDDYFTNRQDRYHIFASKAAADFFGQIHNTMCRMSFQLVTRHDESYDLVWPPSNACPSPIDHPEEFTRVSRSLFEPFVTPAKSPKPPKQGCASVYPVLIIPHAINNELSAIKTILDTSSRKVSSYVFTAGYFNPDPSIKAHLLNTAKSGARATILTASPWANGFYGSKGVSGMLPAAYTLLARRFMQAASEAAPGAVKLREWRLGTVGRPHGWTYHAKGLWLSYGVGSEAPDRLEDLSPSLNPSVTVIGSSNYTIRSYSLDTEVGAVVVTDNERLKAKYKQEEENLLEHSKEVTENDLKGGERKVGPVVRVAMWIVTAIGGSL